MGDQTDHQSVRRLSSSDKKIDKSEGDHAQVKPAAMQSTEPEQQPHRDAAEADRPTSPAKKEWVKFDDAGDESKNKSSKVCMLRLRGILFLPEVIITRLLHLHGVVGKQ